MEVNDNWLGYLTNFITCKHNVTNCSKEEMMPSKPKRPCNKCKLELTTNTYCDKCQTIRRKQSDQRRGSSTERGYNYKWRKARLLFLKLNPLCVHCRDEEDRVTPATVVDHITPHKGDKQLFWDTKNWQPLCKRHHDKKTVLEDGGFGK